MKHRHLLLVASALALFFSFVFMRLAIASTFYVHYGDTDIKAGVWLAIAFLAAWVVLEAVHFICVRRGGVCVCGYSLRGVKCPECGRDQGAAG
jgi:hypothetical protein